MKHVDIFTDGACSGNPGPGGWGVILKYLSTTKELSGGESETTNNRMELTAVIEALSTLKEPCEVSLYTDSQYVANAVNKNWLWDWQRHSWKKSDGKPVKNIDSWELLIKLLDVHKVEFVWIKGHNGYPENERCDYLATTQRDLFKK